MCMEDQEFNVRWYLGGIIHLSNEEISNQYTNHSPKIDILKNILNNLELK